MFSLSKKPDKPAVIFGTTWNRVYSAVKWAVAYGLEHLDLCGIKALGIDEIAYKKGHKYLNGFTDKDSLILKHLAWLTK